MTVEELIKELSQYPSDAPVIATYEGIYRRISVYTSKDGVVVIDADRDHYRFRIEQAKLLPLENNLDEYDFVYDWDEHD